VTPQGAFHLARGLVHQAQLKQLHLAGLSHGCLPFIPILLAVRGIEMTGYRILGQALMITSNLEILKIGLLEIASIFSFLFKLFCVKM
jgi:hypothetical protein